MIPRNQISQTEQLFSHVDGDGTPRIFAVDRLAARILELCLKVIEVPTDPAFAAWCIVNRGVEAHRLERLYDVAVEDFDPVIMCAMQDGTHLLVDGTHRYVSAAVKQLPLKAYLVPEVVWKEFLVEIPPGVTIDIDSMINGYSGL